MAHRALRPPFSGAAAVSTADRPGRQFTNNNTTYNDTAAVSQGANSGYGVSREAASTASGQRRLAVCACASTTGGVLGTHLAHSNRVNGTSRAAAAEPPLA